MPIVPDIPAGEAAVVELTNAFRRENKLAIVRVDPKLSAAAKSYAQFLSQSQLFSHNADGRRPVDRVKASGYQSCQVAENLAMFSDSRGFETRQLAQKIVEGWKNSPGHRRNMLEPHVTEIGVGIVKARSGPAYYSVQLLARPARLKYRFEVQNRSDVAVPLTFADRRQTLKPSQLLQLTVCQPGTLQLTPPGGSKTTHQPKDGNVYTLRRGADGKVAVATEIANRVKNVETVN